MKKYIMNNRIDADFAVTRYDIYEIIREAGRALDPSEKDVDVMGALKRLEVAYQILQSGLLSEYKGDSYFIKYRLPHRPDYDNPYVCTDYEDLVRCVKLEQEGKCTITSINGIEWDKDDFEYYFADEKGE